MTPKLIPPSRVSMPTSADTRSRVRDKALLLVMTHEGLDHPDIPPLLSTRRDADRLIKYLVDREGYLPDNIVLLTDQHDNPRMRPSRGTVVRSRYPSSSF